MPDLRTTGANAGVKHNRLAALGVGHAWHGVEPGPGAACPRPDCELQTCLTCLDGSVVSDTCDDCAARHCVACDPCTDEEDA